MSVLDILNRMFKKKPQQCEVCKTIKSYDKQGNAQYFTPQGYERCGKCIEEINSHCKGIQTVTINGN
jgi:hypothetical protein